DERGEQPEPRHPPGVEALEDGRDVAVAAEPVGHPRGAGRVDQAGAAWRDDRVDVEDRGEPAEADRGCDLGERTGERRVRALRPVVAEEVVRKAGEKDALQ